MDGKDPMQVQEYVTHSWYDYAEGNDKGKHPWDGETKLHYTGPKPPYDQLEVEQKYSWLKTPRWKGQPMEVGPLARLLVGYASGREEFKDGRRQHAEGAQRAGRRPSSRRSAGRRPEGSRPSSSPAGPRSSTASSSPT